jgi:hypothetical protein
MGRRNLCARLGLAAIAAFACTSPAAAASWNAGAREPSVLALAGSQVEWVAPVRSGATGLFEARSQARPRRIQTFPRPDQYVHEVFSGLRASASTVVLDRRYTIEPPDGADGSGSGHLAGAVGRRLSSLAMCPGITDAGGADVSGSVIAFGRCDTALEVRDSSDPEATQVVGRDVHDAAIAGRYVAWLEGHSSSTESAGDFVVYDRETRSEAYRLPAAAFPAQVFSLDVQDDGTVAFSFYAKPDNYPDGMRVGWASRAEPTVHVLPLPRRLTYGVRIAASRIVFVRYAQSARSRGHEIGVTDLQGHARLYSREAGFAFDYDGARIAFVRRLCHHHTVVRMSRSSHPRVRAPRSCPVL